MQHRTKLLAAMLAILPLAEVSAAEPCADGQATLAALTSALARDPGDATLHYYQAAAWAHCGEVDASVAALRRAAEHGDGFLPVRAAGFERIWNVPAFRAERLRLEQRLPRVAIDAPVAFRLADPRLIPEDIAYDARDDVLYVGSIARGEIRRVDAQGEDRVFAGRDDGLEQVLGLAIDPTRRRLYAVSTSQLLPPDEPVRNALLVFDLDTGKRLARLDAADAGQLNGVAVAADGAVYVSDSQRGGIFRASPDDSALQCWIPAEQLRYPNGIAVADDIVYVAHATGIARIDRQTGAVRSRIDNATRETLAAIDGLYYADGALIGVQNWTNPGRLMRFDLAVDGGTVIAAHTLLSHHHPALNEPTSAAIDGERVLLLANSQVGHLQPDGSWRDEDSLRPPLVLALPLRPERQGGGDEHR